MINNDKQHSSEESHIRRARQRLKERSQERFQRFEALRHEAISEAEAIVCMIAEKYKPTRIYQWGSVLRPGGFKDYSDIDVAVEGITDPATFFRMLADAENMTRFPLDLVQIEKIAPEYAEDIRLKGEIVYERT